MLGLQVLKMHSALFVSSRMKHAKKIVVMELLGARYTVWLIPLCMWASV